MPNLLHEVITGLRFTLAKEDDLAQTRKEIELQLSNLAKLEDRMVVVRSDSSRLTCPHTRITKGRTEEEVQQALQIIVDNRDAKALNYAVNYAKAGLYMSGHELKVQVLYVLSNMKHWRSDVARAVRLTLKNYTKNN